MDIPNLHPTKTDNSRALPTLQPTFGRFGISFILFNNLHKSGEYRMRAWLSTLQQSVLCVSIALAAHLPHTAWAQSRFKSAVPDPSHELKSENLLSALRQGGLVIYFRHTSTQDARPDQMHCLGAVMSEKGRQEAEAIGREFERLHIPVTKVLASPVCRTLDSARSMFKDVEADTRVKGNGNDFSALADLMTLPHGLNGNLAMVGHYSGSNTIVGEPRLEFGEALVIRPGSPAVLLARVKISDWSRIAASKN